jgi:hypothetical protein
MKKNKKKKKKNIKMMMMRFVHQGWWQKLSVLDHNVLRRIFGTEREKLSRIV